MLKEIQKSNPLNSFDPPEYTKRCRKKDIDVKKIVNIPQASEKELIMVGASICKDDEKCLSFECDKQKKNCLFSRYCHKDSALNTSSRKNIIYTKKGGVIPAEINYDITINRKLLNKKRFNEDINVPCSKNKIGNTIYNCDREKASSECDRTPNCLAWELNKYRNTCTLYSKCHKPMIAPSYNKNYNVGTKKETKLLGIPRNPKIINVPLKYGENIKILNKGRALKNQNKQAIFGSNRGNASKMKLFKNVNGKPRYGSFIKYNDLVFIESQINRNKLQRKGKKALFANKNFDQWEKFRIIYGPGSKGYRRGMIYDGDIIYLKSVGFNKYPFIFENINNRGMCRTYGKWSSGKMKLKLF